MCSLSRNFLLNVIFLWVFCFALICYHPALDEGVNKVADFSPQRGKDLAGKRKHLGTKM